MYVDAAAKGKLDLAKVGKLTKLQAGTTLSGLLNADMFVKGNVKAIQQQNINGFTAGGTIDLNNFVYIAKDYPSGVKINTQPLFSNTELFTPTLDAFITKLRPFTLSITNGTVLFTWGSYTQTTTISDSTANWQTPTTLVFEYINNGASGGSYGRADNFSNGRFSKQ